MKDENFNNLLINAYNFNCSNMICFYKLKGYQYKINAFIVLLFCCFFTILLQSKAADLKLYKADNIDISNKAVLCMYQDEYGYLWIGTYDGLNLFNSKDVSVHRFDLQIEKSLCSNIIHKITPAEKDYLWISTFLGLNKFSIKDKEVTESFPECPEAKLIASDNQGNTCIILSDNEIQFYNPKTQEFSPIAIGNMKKSDVLALFCVSDKQFNVLLKNGYFLQITIDGEKKSIVKTHSEQLHKYPLQSASFVDNTLYWVDENGWLYRRNFETDQTVFISNIESLLEQYGNISQITPFQDDIYLAFKSNGVLKLTQNNQYKPEKVNMNIGVFSLLNDKYQNILWIGTDGQGVQMYYDKPDNFQYITLNQLPYSFQKPVRAIYTEDSDMWIGTKGEGVIQIKNYDELSENKIEPGKVNIFSTTNGLSSDLVFSITKSKFRNLLWVGTEGPGLSYYSFDDKQMKTPQSKSNWKIEKVHSICETDDHTLWAATAGSGLQKITYHQHQNTILIDSVEVFLFTKKDRICNEFHAIRYIGDSTLLIGSRGGYGLVEFNINTNDYRFIPMNSADYSAIGDVLSLYQSKDSIFYIGASSGLTKMQLLPDNQTRLINQFNRKDGLVNDMIHGILEDAEGCLWFSTNKGLTKYNPRNNFFHNYVQDLMVTEFSDDAYFQDNQTKRLFFGGVNGVIWMDPQGFNHTAIKTNLLFSDLKFFDKKVRWTENYDESRNQITIPAEVTDFTLSFIAVDNYSSNNYEYSYMLESYNHNWINIQKNNEVTFNHLPAGNYVLRVKYNNDVFNNEFNENTISIVVLPPWYLTYWMKICYVLLAFLIFYLIIRQINRNADQKKEMFTRKVEEEQREKLLESKLNFFTNVTHDLCTPLTLISGLTDQIEAQSGQSRDLKKMTSILKSNVSNLNELIQEVLDFRRIEDSGFGTHHITLVNISTLIKEITGLFLQQAKESDIEFSVSYPDTLTWNTDLAFIKKILNNLISNAFKYSQKGGVIKVSAEVVENNLIIRVYNTGVGIHESEIPKLFNRFNIINQEKTSTNISSASRNGLGLSICKSLITSLKGNIDVKSEFGKYAEFAVFLPIYDNEKDVLSADNTEDKELSKDLLLSSNNIQPTVLLVDDNKDITWLISRSLSDNFNILKAGSAIQALEIIKEKTPDLIITDIVMPGISGLEFVRQIKEGKYTKHIPVIIVSAKITNNEQSEGYNIGADAYLTKPFSPQILVSVVNRLLKNKVELKEYYKTSISSYEVTEGKLIHSEDQALLNRVVNILNENIENENLKPGFIAYQLNMNVRSFYRNFKNVSTLAPSDFIKDFRLKYAAKLLLTTKLSVQEVMYNTGFSNKSYFYREFNKKFEMTPKQYRQNEQEDVAN